MRVVMIFGLTLVYTFQIGMMLLLVFVHHAVGRLDCLLSVIGCRLHGRNAN